MGPVDKCKNFIKMGKEKYMLKIHKPVLHGNKNLNQTFWKLSINSFPDGSYLSDNKTKIIFPATKIQTLDDFKKTRKNVLSYNECLDFFKYIGRQLMSLETANMTISCFAINDFVVIDEKYFVFVNDDKIIPINENNKIIFNTPFDKEKKRFLSPELKMIDTLPSEIYFTSGIFSLAKLSIFLLTNQIGISKEIKEKGLFWNQMVDEECIDCDDPTQTDGLCNEILLLDSIFYTKLYWALKRCLYRNPRKRFFLII